MTMCLRFECSEPRQLEFQPSPRSLILLGKGETNRQTQQQGESRMMDCPQTTKTDVRVNRHQTAALMSNTEEQQLLS